MKLANLMMVAVTAGVCTWQLVSWYGVLPDVMPSHFDAAGQVDGESNKAAFYAMFISMHVVFLIGFPLLAGFLRRLPDSTLNIPNKDYWLAPERREQTMSINSGLLIAAGWVTSWLFIGIFQLSANVGIESRATINPEFYWMLGVYVLFTIAGVVFAMLRFRMPQSTKQAVLHSNVG